MRDKYLQHNQIISIFAHKLEEDYYGDNIRYNLATATLPRPRP